MKRGQNLRDEIKWGGVLSDDREGSACAAGPRESGYRCQTPAQAGCDLSDRREVMKKLLAKLVKDETGGEVLEYALIAGLIVVAAIAVIGTVGTKVLARWTSLNSSL